MAVCLKSVSDTILTDPKKKKGLPLKPQKSFRKLAEHFLRSAIVFYSINQELGERT